jgi:DNA transformation protein
VALDDPEYVKELFAGFGPVSVRRMFGGAGVFADGLMIALIAGGELFLKADENTIPAFQAEGAGPFEYGAKGRRVVMSYWRLPVRLFDDPDELGQWARKAYQVAQRASAPKEKRRRPPARKPKPARAKPARRKVRSSGRKKTRR